MVIIIHSPTYQGEGDTPTEALLLALLAAAEREAVTKGYNS